MKLRPALLFCCLLLPACTPADAWLGPAGYEFLNRTGLVGPGPAPSPYQAPSPYPDSGSYPGPSPAPYPYPAPGPSSSYPANPSNAEDYLLDAINSERARAGLRPLRPESRLTQAARRHVRSLASGAPFSHTGPDGSSPFNRMNDAGYNYSAAAENIVQNSGGPDAMVRAWMQSPGHRANILNPQYTETGIAVSGSYAVQTFGTP